MSSMCLKPQCIFYLRWTWADRSLAWFPPRTCWDCCIGWWPGPTAELRGDTSNELLSKAECYQLLVLIVDIMCYIKWRWSSGDMWRVCRCTVHMSHLMSHIWYQPLCHYVSILNDCMMTILVNVKFSFFQSFFFWHCLCNGKAPASKTSRVYNCFLLYLCILFVVKHNVGKTKDNQQQQQRGWPLMRMTKWGPWHLPGPGGGLMSRAAAPPPPQPPIVGQTSSVQPSNHMNTLTARTAAPLPCTGPVLRPATYNSI